MKSYDETPWWCQLLWSWFGPPWYADIEDPDAWLDAIGRQFARQAGELADDLAGNDRPGAGYLAKARRLTASQYRAEEIITPEHSSLTPGDEEDGDEDDERAAAGERPLVIGRDHPSWAEVDAEQRERLGVPPGEDGRS